MRSRRAPRVTVLAALLLAPFALGQSTPAWDELAGGPARTGAAFLPDARLDVLAHRDLFGNGTLINQLYSLPLAETPHGLRALAQRGAECVLLSFDPDGDVAERVLDACSRGTLTAYDRENDRLIVCSRGAPTHPILQARDSATGDLAWAVRPSDLGLTANEPVDWGCRGTAIDAAAGSAFVGMWGASASSTATRVLRVSLSTGFVEWDRPIGAAHFYGGGQNLRAGGVELSAVGFLTPFGITLTETGIVLSARAECACGKGDPDTVRTTAQGAVAWLDADDGDLIGARLAEEDTSAIDGTGLPQRRFHQWWATAQGPLAAFTLGERVLVVNPSEREPVREAAWQGVETGRGFIGILPSSWWGDVIVSPLKSSVTGIEATTLAPRWSWTPGDAWIVSALLVVPPSDVWVLVASIENGADAETTAVVHRLDLATGSVLQRMPLPGMVQMTGGTGRAPFHPLSDGRVLVVSLNGRMSTLGPASAEDRPRVEVSNSYPEPGTAVTIAVESPDPLGQYIVTWGDGAIEEGGTAWTHRYADDGTRTARVTAVLPDGRTATAETLLRVGATPPPELNALQRAVAPENQDLTFGVLGLAATALAGGLAVLARRRRHGRLHEELRALEAIRERGRQDPESAVRALGAFRERVLADLGARRLDDAQFQTLETRANVVFAALRTRLLGPLAGRLGADFRHALDVVLHDGRVDADELASLRAAIEEQSQLSPEERARIVALLARLGTAP